MTEFTKEQTTKFEAEKELVLNAQDGDEDAMMILYNKYQTTIFSVANKYRMKGVNWEDLISASKEGFWIALHKHNPERGYLGTYVKFYCQEMVRKEFRRLVHVGKASYRKHAHSVIEFDETFMSVDKKWPPSEERLFEILERIEEFVEEHFDDRQKYIWERRFTDEKTPIAEIAKDLNVTDQYVSNLFRHCVRRIKRNLDI